MSKYGYLVITTKANISEADHTKILSSYGQQGYRLVKEKKNFLGRTTYILERNVEAPKVITERPSSTNLSQRGVLVIPDKHIYEVTEVLMKGIEASKGSLSQETRELLATWIRFSRVDLGKNLKGQEK